MHKSDAHTAPPLHIVPLFEYCAHPHNCGHQTF